MSAKLLHPDAFGTVAAKQKHVYSWTFEQQLAYWPVYLATFKDSFDSVCLAANSVLSPDSSTWFAD